MPARPIWSVGRVIVCAIFLAAFCSQAVAQTAQDRPVEQLVRVIASDESTSTERLSAARVLAARSGSDRDAFEAINELLAPANDGQPSQVYAIRAIGELGYAPDQLLHPLGLLAERSGERRLPGALTAVAQIKSRSAAGVLMAYARPDRSTATREAAFAALRELSGRDDIANDFQAWLDWLQTSMRQTEDEWIALRLSS